MSIKSQALTAQQRDELRELAYQSRSSMSALISQIIDDYVEGSVVAEVTPVERFDTEVKYVAPASYEEAMAKAKASGLPLSAIIRDEIIRRVAA
jgi:hypothetical protein